MTVVASRRPSSTPRWLILAFGGVLGLGLTSALAALLIFSWPTGAAPSEARVTLPATLIPAPGADPVRITDGKFFLVHLLPGEGQRTGDFVVRRKVCTNFASFSENF